MLKSNGTGAVSKRTFIDCLAFKGTKKLGVLYQ